MGSRLFQSSWDKTIRVWDVETAQVVSGPFEGHIHGVACVKFSPDGKRIASGSWDNTIRVWDTASGQAASEPFEGHCFQVTSIGFSPDVKSRLSQVAMTRQLEFGTLRLVKPCLCLWGAMIKSPLFNSLMMGSILFWFC
jgi:WD40 repeat protein